MKNPKAKKWLIPAISLFWASYLLGFLFACLVKRRFDARYLLSKETFLFFLLFVALIALVLLFYYWSHYWVYNGKNVMKGKPGDKHFEGNLEEAHFQSEEEIERNYKTYPFDELKGIDIVGTPIIAKETKKGLEVTFAKPSHSLVIGTTGSGKTTSYVSPLIQILSETKTKPSFFISDPKGELLLQHKAALERKGYTVRAIDLRNPYRSARWNPLERPYLLYQRSLHLNEEAEDKDGRFLFEGKEYSSKEERDSAVQVKRQELLDDVYDDLNDISTAICPVTSKEDPMWESGAKNFILALLIAMLEDSKDPSNGMTKEKYNFYSLMKIATSTDDDCQKLLAYFQNRDPLSRAVSLSKQVLSAGDKTRASYLSTCFDKLSLFSDMSVCALTSSNEVEFQSMGEVPTALFLEIPDEKETRHALASLLILQAYKELVRKANQSVGLTLPKPVYFILDEFGNLPKVHKLEQMITVGRSRNIWLSLVVQSYSQLSKTYGQEGSDIIKSNCNTQAFIGTKDWKTIEEFSKQCGNYTLVQRSVGYSSTKDSDINSNSTIKERPLIYPSELSSLNRPGDMGHAIVSVFGYQPIRSTFTPCYLVREFDMTPSPEVEGKGRYFDEAKALYDFTKRNSSNPSRKAEIPQPSTEQALYQIILEQNVLRAKEAASYHLSDKEIDQLEKAIRKQDAKTAMKLLSKATTSAEEEGDQSALDAIEDVRKRILDMVSGERRPTGGK